MLKLTFVLGTRPEVIKLAPLIRHAKEQGHQIKVVLTGQHRDMAIPLLRFFGIQPDLDLDVMTPNQTLTTLSERVLKRLNESRDEIAANYLIVQGDTTSAFIAAYWAFCQKIPVAHVEAGLRTYDLESPYPEEANRQLIGRIAKIHLAPTLQAQKALEQEHVPSSHVHWVGNTAIDALHFVLKKIDGLTLQQLPDIPTQVHSFIGEHPLILVTAHRRESFGEAFEGICQGLLKIAEHNPQVRILYPVHPNPNVREPVQRYLGKNPQILLCNPVPYVGFIGLMKRASVLLTDSGGIQEEGPTLRKPILIMREKTERPEGVLAGFSKLVGTNPQAIRHAVEEALLQGLQTQAENPYGDGLASQRILQILNDTHKIKIKDNVVEPTLHASA